MSTRRLLILCLLLCLNLLLGIFYIQPTFMSNSIINDTEYMILTSDENLGDTALNESFRKIIVPSNNPEAEFPMFYNFTLNSQDLCLKNTKKKNSKLSLIILVCTAIPNVSQRQAIRETWGSEASENNNTGYIRLAFLVGSTNNPILQQQINEEFHQYNDIIQQNFIDSYKNLTLKSIMLLKWVSDFCPNVNFVLKIDDDMYLNIPNLLYALFRSPVKSNVMYGVLFKKAKPNRNPAAKWFVPKKQFGGSTFPDYLSGTGYAMSRDAVPKLLEASAVLNFLVMEDVFITGMCASESHVRRFNVRGFAYWKRPPTGCAFKDVITGHHVTVSEMRKIWSELQKNPSGCRQSRKI